MMSRMRGTSAINAPQSGLTSWLMNWSRLVQSWSMAFGVRGWVLLAARRAGHQHVEHHAHRGRERDEHRDAGEIDVPAEVLRARVIRDRDHDERDPDDERETWLHAMTSRPVTGCTGSRTAGSRRCRRNASTTTSPPPCRGGRSRTGPPSTGTERPTA